ncbi:MAG: DUF4339 domain-containing protein [Deltaproteobacteria bacterium]|nr:DUF4339 domain-containing protein [Deltaproteobacteria bacterium]
MARAIPPLVHVRAPSPAASRPSVAPPSSSSVDDLSARTMPVDTLRRELQSGALPRDTEVLFAGLGDWTAATEIPELWIAPAPVPVAAEDPALEHDAAVPSIPVSSTSSSPKRRSFGALAIVGAASAALALLAVGAASIYFFYFYYKPVAVLHLPRQCVAAARAEVWDVGRFEPLVKKLVPAIEQATRPPPPPGPPPPPAPTLEERLKSHANIDLSRGELHEVAACVFQDTTIPTGTKDPLVGYRAIVAIGGKFRSGVIPGLFEALRPELAPLAPRLDGSGESAVIRILPSKASGGIAFVIGQAEDGTILVAPNDAALAAAREPRTEEEAHATTGLREQGSLEITLEHVFFGLVFRYDALGPPPAGFEAIYKPLADVTQGRFALTLGKQPKVELSFEQKTESAAKETEGALRKLLEIGNSELTKVPKDWAGEHAALGGARVRRDDTRVDVVLDFRLPDVDRGAGEFADQIKDPASPFRKSTWPVVAWKLGVGPKPASSAATSASIVPGAPGVPGAPSAPPSFPPPPPLPTEEED